MFSKVVYISSPLKGDIKANIEKTVEYCKQAKDLGYIPYAPHVLFTTFINDNNPLEREIAMKMGLEMLKKCDELWVFGGKISEGMAGEILEANKLGISVYSKSTKLLKKRIKMKYAQAA